MSRKKTITTKKTKALKKQTKYCNHCGGALRFLQEGASCLMCGRDASHFCENCLTNQKLIKKSA